MTIFSASLWKGLVLFLGTILRAFATVSLKTCNNYNAMNKGSLMYRWGDIWLFSFSRSSFSYRVSTFCVLYHSSECIKIKIYKLSLQCLHTYIRIKKNKIKLSISTIIIFSFLRIKSKGSHIHFTGSYTPTMSAKFRYL